jgi:hypothetical protein
MLAMLERMRAQRPGPTMGKEDDDQLARMESDTIDQQHICTVAGI